MKKLLLTAAVVFAFSFANAQEVKFGAKAGLNLSNVTGDVNGNSSKVGFHVGGFAEIKLAEKFSLQPELLFSSQGAKFTGGSSAEMDYINIPVMAKYYIVKQFSVEAGPQIGFLVSAKGKGGGQTVDIKDEFKSTDFGINVGTGYDFTDHISAGLRYNVGLANIAVVPAGSTQKVGNGVFSLSAAYKF